MCFVEYDRKVKTCPESLRVVLWNYSNLGTIKSTMGSAQPVTNIPHWDKSVSTTVKTQVKCPALIKHYNANMRGVDQMEAMISFYRKFFSDLKSHTTEYSFTLQLLASVMSGCYREGTSRLWMHMQNIWTSMISNRYCPLVWGCKTNIYQENKRGRCKKLILQIISCNMMPKVPSIPLQHQGEEILPQVSWSSVWSVRSATVEVHRNFSFSLLLCIFFSLFLRAYNDWFECLKKYENL